MIPRWLWWSTLILLLLRNQVTASKEISEESKERDEEVLAEDIQDTNGTRPLTAAEMDVPECKTNYDCVMHGLCLKDREGKGRCLCPRSCSALVPLECRMASHRKSAYHNISPCLVMGEFYTERFDMPEPYCHVDRGQDKGRCVCPPMFDPVNHTKLPIRELLPTKCDKRDLRVLAIAHPAEEVYKGTDVTLYCCVNIDPANHIDANGVTFIQNDTVTREPSKHPFRETARSRAYDILMAPSCWELEIRNVQVQDSGNYMCMVTPASGFASVNHSVSLHVKEREKRHRSSYLRAKKLTIERSYPPRMIQNLAITVNETAANVTWDIPDGNSVPNINATLWRRLGTKQFVWEKINISSPINITGLRAATPFTLAINISDGQIEPYPILEHFTTMDGKSNAPRPVSVRVGLNSGAAAGSTLNCEVEWRAPSNPNGRITKYYVRVQGNLRHPRPDGTLVPSDYPSSVDKKCANYDEAEIAANGINPIDFSGELHYCKYGPLKPNRNYTVTIWAENGAGMSTPLIFKEQCLTHYAQPDHVEKPSSQLGVNTTTFNLNFNTKFDDMNGPISCYYIAVVPLPSNVSIDSLTEPHDMIVDSMSRAFSNNLVQGDRERKVFIAYIAESYKDLPAETIIGDDRAVAGYPPCNVQYLSRHKAEDRALRPGMKYTGYLIVRVDRSNPYGTVKEEMVIKTGPARFARNVMMYDDQFDPESLAASVGGQKAHRQMRQLHLNGPVYGFSGYFKPIFLSEDSGRNAVVTALLVMGSIVLFLIVCGFLAMFILQKRGILNDYCPLKLLKKENSDRILLRPSYKPIPVEDLCSEYTIRHRDSDFLFTQEYESLPSACHESSASMKKENLCKNRYNDIKAYDSTRVKLKKTGYDENSDYINANFINSWNNKKKFIAAQAPLENTVEDFWRMVLEQDCSIIVMVANLVEKSRIQCVKYWPDSDVGSQRYGRYRVSLVHSIYNAFYTVRTFDVYEDSSRSSPNRRASVGSASDMDSEYANVPSSRINGTKSERTMRRVYQYHFTNWSDYRAPECSTGLLRFLHILRALDEYNHKTVLIHCSAGVGRTGTFIAIDGMLDQAEEEGKVDIYGFVSGLRKQRNLMVQSLEQYVFVYKAMAEWYLFGYTDLEQDDVELHYRQLLDSPIRSRSYSSSNLRSVIRIDNHRPTLNGLDSEYQKLSQCVDAPPKISFGLRDENIMRNRPGSALPYDKNRVVLSPMLACTDYFNASEMKGYFYPFILAQDPVSEETAFDFWRMVDGKEVSTIVMLSPEDEWSSSEQYWPEDSQKEVVLQKNSNSSSNKFIIVLESKEKFNHYVVRKMHYRTSANREVRSVWQFCLTDWPEGPLVPASLKSIPDLIARVLERQSKQRQTGHILLHCRDGSFRSGLFCCLSLLLERLKAEQKVDVFQTVKTLQLCREKIITNLDQYDFCYRCVIDYHKRSCASLT